MTSSVLTIILNYKTAEMTLQSAESARIAMQGMQGEITIVDNASGDGSDEAIRAHIAEHGWGEGETPVRFVQSGHNGGFGAGNNVGIRAGFSDGSSPDYVYILNSDAFPAPDAIRVLRDRLDTYPKTGFAGSYIHGDDGETHLTSFRFPSILSEFEGAIMFGPVSRLLRNHAVPVPTPAQSHKVDWLAGASMMMRSDILDKIGLFDETFFLYFEETDLCRRLARAGYDVIYVRESRVMHIGSVSTGMKAWARVPGYWFDSRLHYFTQNHGRFYAAMATLAHLAGGSLHWLRFKITRRALTTPPHFLRSLAAHHLRALGRKPQVRSIRPATAPAALTGE